MIDTQIETYLKSTWDDSFILEQDSGPVHTAPTVKEFFQQKNIQILDWPAKSLDLNSIQKVSSQQFENQLKTAIKE